MKKIGFSVLGLVVVAAIYYFTSGSEQLTLQIKQQIASKVATLKTQGFTVEKKTSDNKEHFILSFDEPTKIAKFLNTQGAQLTPNDVASLKGLKVGVDVSYLADAYSAASFDIYPIALPNMKITKNDKKTLQKIQSMIDKKTFLLHVDVNKLGTGFQGYMKDINEILVGELTVNLKMTALKFNGDIKDDRLTAITQTLKNLSIKDNNNEINMQLNHLKSHYATTGDTPYDYTTDYTIEEMLMMLKDAFALRINNMSISSNSNVKNHLASVNAQTEITSILFTQAKKTTLFETFILDMRAENFDIQAIKKLETIDPNNEKELLATFQKLISKGVRFEIPNFSIKNITFKNQKLEGFKLTSSFDIDKSLDLSSLKNNPMSMLGKLDANLRLVLSNQLFGLLAQQPQAMLAMMLFHPKDVNGQKVYKLELKDGSLTVNDKKAM